MLVYETSSEADVVALGEKLRALVEASRLDLPQESVTVTISLGATLLRFGDSPESLVRRADQLMYRSKDAGRNRVTGG